MALHWDWKEKCGEMIINRTHENGTHEEITISLYEGNAFLIMLEEREKTWQMWSFWADETHAKNCLGLTRGTDNMYLNEYTDRITEVIFWSKKSHYYKKIVSLLVRAFDDITITIRSE